MTDEQDTNLPPEGTTPDPGGAEERQPISETTGADTASPQPPPAGTEGASEVSQQKDVSSEGAASDEASQVSVSDEPGPAEAEAADAGSGGGPEGAGSEDAMLKMLDDLPQEQSESSAEDIEFGGTSVSKAEFQQLSEPAAKGESANIDLLMDVNLPVSIELGRTQLSIADILSLGPGSVVELARLAGEPVDVMVNHKLVARGEVVVVDEHFGVRITQLITPEERLKILGEG